MPSKLLDRLNEFLDESPAGRVMAGSAHWPAGVPRFGSHITTVQTVVIHETTGYPSYRGAQGFVDRYIVPGTPDRGFGPHFYMSGNGIAFRLIDIDPTCLTWHATYINGVSVGVENGDLGDQTEIGPDAVVLVGHDHPTAAQAAAAQAAARSLWRTPSNNTEDLTGRKLQLLLHPISNHDGTTAEGVLIWFGTANYDGPQDMTGAGAGFRRMLFTERNYRSLALLCRFLAEKLQLPRNFPLLPYEQMELNIDNVSNFRRIALSDERVDMIAAAAGTNTSLLEANDAALATWYRNQIQSATATFKRHNKAWRKMLDNSVSSFSQGGFRGFHGHGFAGDIYHYDNHTLCPGPFFDWHRFAREVWDWWWYPFDFDRVPPTTTVRPSTTPRPYRKARRTTTLREYYYDADGQPTDYTAVRVAGDFLLTNADSFSIPTQTPIYAMANGALVAAAITNPTPPIVQSSTGFVLIRHEIFFQVNRNRIDYDQDPVFVYSLTYYLNHSNNTPTNISDANPEWFNRFLMRLKETELAIDWHTNHLDNPLRNAWARVPGVGHQPSLGDQITTDATDYRAAANLLSTGNVALFPLERRPGATPVRVILGDYLGQAGTTNGAQTGILVDIFTANPIPPPLLTATPISNPRHAASPFASAEWWSRVCRFLQLKLDPAKELPADGIVWHYDVVDFLSWINGVTWKSEWQKYGITDALHPDGPPRPRSRR